MQDEHSTSPLLEVSDAEISNSANENDLFRLKGGVRTWALIWENIVRLGLREFTLRLGTGLALIVLALLVVWVMGNFYLKGQVAPGEIAAQAAPLPTATVTVEPVAVEDVPADAFMGGIGRLAQIHTILPSRPRFEIIQYKVLKGDTLIGIAEKYGLRPESIFWGNYNVLGDDPHKLRIGQNLNILPVDGILYQWHQGDGLNSVAKFYGVSVESIINWPGNHLDTKTIGDVSHPNISAGTEVMIPGGKREFVTWSAPRITRANPSVAKIFGPGACGKVEDGPVGIGTFIWPTTEKYLSGYDYSPETNHWGIDIAGALGNPIFASDNGVVVYAGWNDWGYGNVVVIDHGDGWQTLYAHLSAVGVSCGAYVYQGGTLGQMGSTGASSGPHLHFEMLGDSYGRANPWNFLDK
jgi:murein DD-endopeptidase MepM/ murein hydrolase activator NlpD